ncbi:MAG: GH3 auxin-responsive promoter family protein [Gammaproteobacteria bacterium]|nr:GH3 auxin-responsive promoter family protein [Gammaproteobacteria bacterium]
MKLDAAIANNIWLAASMPEFLRFNRAATRVEATQRQLLSRYLRNNSTTEFGRAHNFTGIRCWEEFVERVPVRNYDALAPWITKIAAGGDGVLTAEPVRLLEPSSGSSGAEKWIPYTSQLQTEFRRGVATWIAGLFLEMPALTTGRAYWSLTPPAQRERTDESSVPIGFDQDSAYLGGLTQRLIGRTLAAPEALRLESDMERFWRLTLLSLLRCRDLRLISAWHPTYILLLLRYMRDNWSSLLDDLATGLVTDTLRIRSDRSRCRELSRLGPDNAAAIWPELRLISCWADAHAAHFTPDLCAEFPGAHLQAKGLIATEAFVTLPLAASRPLAIRSHFLEFLDERGDIHPAWSLEEGSTYSVVVTTGGGLYRYALQDQVRVTGFYRDVASLRFLGKADNVADHFGEKLNEAFVAACLDHVFALFDLKPRFAMLALDSPDRLPAYALYLEQQSRPPPELSGALEEQLRRNPHYDLCIRLGQLHPVRTFLVRKNAYEVFARTLVACGAQLGNIKPTPLSRRSDWSKHFADPDSQDS